MAARRRQEIPTTEPLGRGVRLHVVPTRRFTTSHARVVFHRDLGPEATATAVLAEVLQSATARHPTREALAHHLDLLYGASLGVSVRKLGDRQLLSASLEWPTRGVGDTRRARVRGLELLRDVIARPLRDATGLDGALVARERANHRSTLASLTDDKSRYAARRCLEIGCRGEPYGLDALGRARDLDAVDPASLDRLHRDLVARAPVEVFLVGAWDPARARGEVEDHLLWAGRAARPRAVAAAVGVKPPRARPRHVREEDAISQARLVLLYRAAVGPRGRAFPAALTLSGILGGPSGELFRVVREQEGLCYRITGAWHPAKGLFVVEAGIDPANERRVRRLVRDLVREAASNGLGTPAHEAFLQAASHGVAVLADDPPGQIGWMQECLALGLDPSPRRHLDHLAAVDARDLRALGSRLGLDASFLLAPRPRRTERAS